MTRFHGPIGYQSPGNLVDGVWSAPVTERSLYGEILEATRALSPADKVNDDIRLRNRIRVMADAFALENFAWIKYVSWNGTRWTVDTVSVERPRLILTLGGVWDGDTPEV